ncbi:flavodoxin [Clostridium botulinum A2 117]|uniref:flavodoxin family protein n=1 Tax=Clostridium botulinum TaxID=1491 RepID=UPI0007DE5760|nr:flavodoxin family protein [Clostridium botulinum]KEI77784.1 flavodoxin [Clostridium botulinum A2 117]MBN3414955.1 flavodoxin family protein [Clostridium botulinum]MBN3441248.1 flavodoxin family protein [Clostridium botulinum]MBY6805317.1 flavodoxin family protein [Clostridium botulinum]MCS4469946.1 flavodoxin family protein [Clostridium botulinum]
MKKSILVLTGSPRKGGNSDSMADSFIEGAIKSGHSVIKYETAIKNIKGCKACDTCFSKGVACSFQDDFNELAPMLEFADVLVIVSPLYWSSFPAQLKAAIDKLYAFVIGGKCMKIRESLLLACGELNSKEAFDVMVKTYEELVKYEKWTDIGRLIVPGVLNKGDIKNTNALKKAKELGLNIK